MFTRPNNTSPKPGLQIFFFCFDACTVIRVSWCQSDCGKGEKGLLAWKDGGRAAGIGQMGEGWKG